MGRGFVGVLGLTASSLLPAAAYAQAPAVAQAPLTIQAAAAAPSAAPGAIGGIPTIDLITVQAVGPGVPLRFGNVLPGSERVQLNGQPLEPGIDYVMDYGTGVVYLRCSQTAGQTLTVSYHYNPNVDPKLMNEFS